MSSATQHRDIVSNDGSKFIATLQQTTSEKPPPMHCSGECTSHLWSTATDIAQRDSNRRTWPDTTK